ncbi:MAG: PadR family transcriptional regulator [Sarcina sp.]
MNAQFKKGILELCILSEVKKSDKYGYKIVQCLDSLSVNEGTVYPILRRLTKEGLFESYIVESEEGPARKYYKITNLGEEKLKVMLTEWEDFYEAVKNILGGTSIE